MISNDLLEYIKDNVKKYFGDTRVTIYLFGSRARGDNSERSDWDIAYVSEKESSEFVLEITEGAPTLSGIDLVYFNSAQDELKSKILEEGKIIYEH